MKRLFNVSLLMIAMVAMVACGGNSKKSEKASDEQTTENAQVGMGKQSASMSKALALAAELMEALETGDMSSAKYLQKEFEKLFNELSTAEQKQLMQALESGNFDDEYCDDEYCDDEYCEDEYCDDECEEYNEEEMEQYDEDEEYYEDEEEDSYDDEDYDDEY